MTGLITTLEQLTGPSREADAQIYRALVVDTPMPNGPEYTASLDATIALCERVLPGWQWAAWGGAIEIGSSTPRCMAHVSDGRQQWTASDTPNAAIALLIALLKAKETSNG